MALIYLATNTTNGKQYVGFTAQPLAVRRDQHERAALRGGKVQRAFHGAIRKHGVAAFEWAVLVDGFAADVALEIECAAIAAYGSRVPAGYNLSEGGDCPEWHPESRKLMSEAALNSPKAQAHRARLAADPVFLARRNAATSAAKRALSDEQEEDIFFRYQAGATKLSLGVLFGVTGQCTHGAIRRVAKRLGITPRNGRECLPATRAKISAPQRCLTPAQEQELVRLRNEGKSGPQIISAMRITKPTFYNYLHRLGQSVRAMPAALTAEQEAEVVRLRKAGVSIASIRADLGVGKQAVYSCLRRQGQYIKPGTNATRET